MNSVAASLRRDFVALVERLAPKYSVGKSRDVFAQRTMSKELIDRFTLASTGDAHGLDSLLDTPMLGEALHYYPHDITRNVRRATIKRDVTVGQAARRGDTPPLLAYADIVRSAISAAPRFAILSP